MPVTSVQKFLYKNIEYPTYAEARAAEKADEDAAVAVYDPVVDVVRYEQIFDRMAIKRWNKPGTFPMFLYVGEKHDNYIVYIGSVEDIINNSLKLVSSRVNEGYWYLNQNAVLAKSIVDTQNGKAAYMFLSEQSGEYEEVSLRTFSTL